MDHPDIAAYIKEAEVIEKMYMELLGGTTQRRTKRIDDGSTGLQNVEYRICVINSKNEILQSALLQRYEDWYGSCQELVSKYAGTSRRSQYEDSLGLHGRILKLIDLEDPVSRSSEKKHLRKEFIACFDAQVGILHSIRPFVASARNNHESLDAADTINSELDEAEDLYEQGSVHNACIIAGNALERYLKMQCNISGVELESEDTMLSMAQKLHESNKVYGFDLEMLGVIEHLVALSCRCSSDDEEPREDDVRELIERVRELTFLVFC